MINMQEVLETNNMIAHEKLDVQDDHDGIILLDCDDSDLAKMNEKIYNKITTYAKDLVSTGDATDVNLVFRSSINVSRLLRSRW